MDESTEDTQNLLLCAIEGCENPASPYIRCEDTVNIAGLNYPIRFYICDDHLTEINTDC